MPESFDARLAQRLKSQRLSQDWSLDQLAANSGVSRATLSRIEQAKVSPTAHVLASLCAAYDLPVSRLIMRVEHSFDALVPYDGQSEQEDTETGFTCRAVSPPAEALSGDVTECHLPPDTIITIDAPERPGREHHLILQDGAMIATIEGVDYPMMAGDCLRFHQSTVGRFSTTPQRGARYLLVQI